MPGTTPSRSSPARNIISLRPIGCISGETEPGSERFTPASDIKAAGGPMVGQAGASRKREPMPEAFINRIATANPPHDVHASFLYFGRLMLRDDRRRLALFNRMAERSGIAHRYSYFQPGGVAPELDGAGFYRLGDFPNTAERMRKFENIAPGLAVEAVEKLLGEEDRSAITHLLVTSCTGFSAPGIDLALVERCGLNPSIERTMLGFMGCYAAINALKLARHIVRSEPKARVLAVNLELCTLHLHETADLEEILSFLLFADGCAAALVSADPVGIGIQSFQAA